MGGDKQMLGEMLVSAGVINQGQLQEALAIKETTQEKIGQILLSKGYIDKSTLMDFIQQQSQATIRKTRDIMNQSNVPDVD